VNSHTIYMIYIFYDHWKTQREYKDYLEKSQTFKRYIQPISDYIEAGAPYGWNDEGLHRWLREREQESGGKENMGMDKNSEVNLKLYKQMKRIDAIMAAISEQMRVNMYLSIKIWDEDGCDKSHAKQDALVNTCQITTFLTLITNALQKDDKGALLKVIDEWAKKAGVHDV